MSFTEKLDDLWIEIYTRLPGWIVDPGDVIYSWCRVREFKSGDIVEDCSYHPCVVRSVDRNDRSVHTYSLLTGAPSSCDLFHCGVKKLTPEEVREDIEVYRKEGARGLVKLRGGWTDKQYDDFERNSHKE